MAKNDQNTGFWSQLFHKLSNKSLVPRPQTTNVYQNQQQQRRQNMISQESSLSLIDISTDGSTVSLEACCSDTLHYNTARQSAAIPYESLWEVQLALGEIPGIFEENILQPCQPRNPTLSPPPPAIIPQYTFPKSYSTVPFATMNFEERPEYPFSRHVDDEDRFQYPDEADQSYDEDHNKPIWYYPDTNASDIGGDLSSLLPSQNDCATKCEYRQDRKDSGVFVQDWEGAIYNISPKSKEQWYKFEELFEAKTGQERIPSLRELVMGEDLQQMENGSFLVSSPSLMANVSSISLQM
ncbi:hypothetical protein BGZ65_000139 [Modicella reniformis]|uniref:Uncharacterized protein n=1 Tax=Modicella reniformis TaxID=1440133 RepID=A0A9P6SVV7_9FUNG|nr:hypothetical protein BGZ65_000139 [Modicella reniformis]